MTAKERHYYIIQWLVAILANMTLLTYGLQSGWISPMKKVLQSDATPLDRPLSELEMSWIASLLCLAAFFGVPIYTYIADNYGRKWGIIAIAIPQAICWILKLSTSNTIGLMLARVLCGIPAGGCYTIVPMYVKEIAHDNIRGLLGSLLILMQNIGILAMYAMGSYLDYHLVLWVVLAIPVLTAVLMLKAPESPAYLVKRGNIEEATSTVAFLNGLDTKDPAVVCEIQTMNKDDDSYKSLPKISYMTILKTKPWRIAMFLSVAQLSVASSNGNYSIITYASSIMESSGVTIKPELQALSFPAVMIAASFASICCIERVGRRVILFTCYGVTVLSQLCLASVQLAISLDVFVPDWVPIICMILSLCAYSGGAAPMPYIMMAEMFNFQIRAKAIGSIVMYAWLVSFTQISLYSLVSAALGVHTAFYGFAVINSLGFLLTWYLPETRGKTVHEIEELLEKK